VVAIAPVGLDVGDRPEIGVDRQLMAGGVIASCLVFEVTDGAGAVAS
jgi:hypothetical protein